MIIIGLGNQGDKYKNTRHNVGHQFAEVIDNAIKSDQPMNLSGECVKKYIGEDISIIYDDVDIPLGKIKIKRGGSSTHNGVRSVIKAIGGDFTHIRIGIGKPDKDISEYVLEDFTQEEQEVINKLKKDFTFHFLEL